MVACKVYLAVAVVFVAAVQIHGKPADTDWGLTFIDQLKNLTSQMSNVMDNSEYATAAKNGLNTIADGVKAEIEVLSKSLNGKADVSEMVKESTKQWQMTADKYIAELPKDVNLKSFKEKTEQALKAIVEHATEVTKKAQGNTEIEKQVREATKKSIDYLMKTVNEVQAKITEATKKI